MFYVSIFSGCNRTSSEPERKKIGRVDRGGSYFCWGRGLEGAVAGV